MKIWLETDEVRRTEEQRDRLGREVIKLGPRILRYYSKSKMAVILLKQSKNCTWNSMYNHSTSYITKEGVQKLRQKD